MSRNPIIKFTTKRDVAITITILLAAIAIITAKSYSKPSQNYEKLNEEEVVSPKKILSTSEKKQRFYDIILEPTRKVFSRLEKQYQETKKDIEKNPNSEHLETLRKTYKAKNNQELLTAIKPHPISLALSQAAMESAWGTSRFFNEANNIFGIWSFNKNEPRIAAKEKRGNKTIWIKKYDSIEDSIENYYKTLATGSAYKEFRKEKMLSNNSMRLTRKLDKYSEKGAKYGEELSAIIKYNDFQKFD
ncbi:MAG: Bax protein [Lentimonas sp.]|jgi:Bax protein